LGAHERLEEPDFEGGADGEMFESLEEFLDFGALAEVAARDVMAEDFIAELLEALGIGLFVHAVDGGLASLNEMGGDGFVGQKHEFFDQLVGNIVFEGFDVGDAAAVVEADFSFGEVEGEGAVGEAALADELGEAVGVVEHAFDGGGWGALENGEGFGVGEAPAGMDDGGVEAGTEDAAIVGEEELDGLGESIDIGFEGAEFVAERFREHGNDAVDEVG
jgi:hypothetical protein